MIAVALLFSGIVFGSAPSGEAAKNYRFELDGTSREVQAGKSGTLKLTIRPAEGYKVSAEAPLKIGLQSEGLDLAKKTLGHADAKDKKSIAPEFSVGFDAGVPGEKSIQVDATFFVCNEKLCERKNEKVNVPVKVKP